MRTASVTLFVVLAAVPVQAEEKPPPSWTGQISASYVANSGNTNNSTAGASGELAWQPGQYRIVLAGEYIRTKYDNHLGSNRLGAALRAQRTLPARLSIYTEGSYYEDVPSGTRHQVALNAGGLGHILKGEKRSLVILLSLTQTWENRVVSPDRDFLGSQIGIDGKVRPTNAVTLEHSVSYIRDFSDATNWRVKAETSLSVALARRFAFKCSHRLYRNKPDPGRRATDQTMMASLVMHWPAPKDD